MAKYNVGIASAAPIIGILVGLIAAQLMPPQTRPQPASAASAGEVATECPPSNDKGAYFERGRDKDGNAICGFAWYNACPYTEAVPADDPMCDKAKPTEEQLKPWQPEPVTTTPATETTTNTCGGK